MNETQKLLIIRKQAEIAKAALSEMTLHIPMESEAVHSRANLAVDAVLALSATLDETNAKAV